MKGSINSPPQWAAIFYQIAPRKQADSYTLTWDAKEVKQWSILMITLTTIWEFGQLG